MIKIGDRKYEQNVFVVFVSILKVISVVQTSVIAVTGARGKEIVAKSRMDRKWIQRQTEQRPVSETFYDRFAIIFLEAGCLLPDRSSASFPVTINGRADASR